MPFTKLDGTELDWTGAVEINNPPLSKHLNRLYFLDNHIRNQIKVCDQSKDPEEWSVGQWINFHQLEPNERAIKVAEHYQRQLMDSFTN